MQAACQNVIEFVDRLVLEHRVLPPLCTPKIRSAPFDSVSAISPRTGIAFCG